VASRLEEALQPYYISAVVRRFFFYLPHPNGSIAVDDLVTSKMFSELLELKQYESTSSKQINWFSPGNFKQIYGQFQRLDTNRDGFLDFPELACFGTRSFSPEFLKQVMRHCNTKKGTMGFKEFVDWSIAMGDKKSPASMKYMLNILDMEGLGYIDKAAMRYYLTGVMRVMVRMGCNTVPPEDVIDEIYDMVTPKDPERMTLQDLVKSTYGDVCLHMLGEGHSFYCYDNRESLKAEEQARAEQEASLSPSPPQAQIKVTSGVSTTTLDYGDDGDDDDLYSF